MQRYTFIDTGTKAKIVDWTDRVVGRIRTELHNQNVNASGNLSRSVEGVVGDDSIQILADNYFLYAEKGRNSGKIPRNFIDIINQWIDDKGLQVPSGYRNQRQFAAAIAFKIKKYGSHKWRNPVDRTDVVGGALSAELPELNNIIQNRIVAYVNDNLF